MPFEKMSRSSGSVHGLKVTGRVKKEDYGGLTEMVREVVEGEGEVNLLLDREDFDWAEISAWGADWRFSREFHDKMKRMAIVGSARWQRFAATIADPLFIDEANFYAVEDRDDAWEWLLGSSD